eukprot:g29272.t1
MINGEFQTSEDRKVTHTDQILNFHSNHPRVHKQSCIRILLEWARTRCNTSELRRKEEEHQYKTLAINGYPRNFIHRCLLNRKQLEDTVRPNTLATLPYIKNISELATRLLRPLGIM